MSEKRSYWRGVWLRFKKRPAAMFGLSIAILLLLAAIFAPFIAGERPIVMIWKGKIYAPIIYEPRSIKGLDYKGLMDADARLIMPPIPYLPNTYNLDEVLLPPSKRHPLGTDEQGRDVASQVIWGARTSLVVGILSVFLYTAIGLLLGAIAGYFGGVIDMVVSRLIEVMLCFPSFFLMLALLAMGSVSIDLMNIHIKLSGIHMIIFVIGITGWTGVARLVRGEVLKLKQLEYVAAAKVAGASPSRIIFRHILPHAISPVVVVATFGVASAILAESGLSFLGFGVPPYVPSWGGMLSRAQDFMDTCWWLVVVPGAAIFVTTLAYNLIGEALRDAMDPRLVV